jgi:hypothetical protein
MANQIIYSARLYSNTSVSYFNFFLPGSAGFLAISTMGYPFSPVPMEEPVPLFVQRIDSLAHLNFLEPLLLVSGRGGAPVFGWTKSAPEQPLFHSLPERAEGRRRERKLSGIDSYGK